MTRLELLQRAVTDAATAIPFDQEYSALLRVEKLDADDELQVGVKDLDGDHPLTALMGVTAPQEWWAIGTITTGWIGPMDDVRPSAHPDGQRVAQAIAVTRDADVVCHVRMADGETMDDPPSTGLVLEALHRTLGLPTSPTEGFAADIFLVLWLHFVEAEARDARANLQKMTWVRAARCFPFASTVKNSDVREPAAFADLFLRTVDGIGWEKLRQWGARGSLGKLIQPELARWMDDGMFSRWMAGSLPPVYAQLERTCQRLAPHVSTCVREAVDALLLGAAASAA